MTPIAIPSDCILKYWPNACDSKYNERVIQFIQNVKETGDPKYKRSKQLHKTKQAGVYHLGNAFEYRKECFSKSDIPDLFKELQSIAEKLTGVKYDIVLFKVYQPGESLANHQDVDGSNMNVCCFTFATSDSQLCKLAWYKYNGKRNSADKKVYSYSNPQCFTPDICSMWFMSGSTNSKYSHQVLANHTEVPGLRVSVSFRQGFSQE